MIFECTFGHGKISLEDAREQLMAYFRKDFNDLSDETRREIRPRFDNMMRVLFVGSYAEQANNEEAE
jgi:hypothetical protein